VDRRAVRGDLGACIGAAVRGGVDWVQVRERDLTDAALLELADAVSAAARNAACGRPGRPLRVIVNRRADVALCIGADGVHLGFDAVEPDAARRLLGDTALIGVSTHDPDEVGTLEGSDYAHLAPIFAPLSKPVERRALGLSALGAAARHGLPVLAQGGIDASNAGAAIRAGAAGIAVTGAVLLADDPEAAARGLREQLDG
jgi:thiamine-phosphate pyrophosphorylase